MPANPIITADIRGLLNRTEQLWPDLKGSAILLTGATGFVGTWLLEALLSANDEYSLGCRVLAVSRNPAFFAERTPHLASAPAVTWITGDVRDFHVPAGDVTHVIHAATESASNLNSSNPQEMFDVCVTGTRRVLTLAMEKRVSRMIFTSSGAVYGRQPAEFSHLPEDYTGGPDQLDRRNAYAEGKRAGEFLCALAASEPAIPLAVTIARCFAFVGPHLPLDRHFAIGNFIRDGLAGGPIQIAGDGTPIRSYLYAADLVEWLITILLRGTVGQAYNVGSEEAVSLRQLAQHVARAANLEEQAITLARVAEGNLPAERYVPSCRKAREALFLTPSTTLDEAIRRTCEFHRHHPSH